MPRAVTVPELVSGVRTLSGLRTNQFCTDLEITDYLNDANRDLVDKFIATFESYFITSFNFSVSGSLGSNIVTLPSDFQKDNGLDRLNSANQPPSSVPMLPSWEERNGPIAAPGSITSGPGLCYWIQGNANQATELRLLPTAAVAVGNYTLWYTPEIPDLFDPAITWTSGDHATGFTNDLNIAAANFDSTYIGQSITITGTVSNNGTFTIATVVSPTHITVSQSLTGESFPSTTTYSSQPAGTIGTLPAKLVPWSLYLRVHASIAVRTKQQKDTSDLEAKLQQQDTRIQKMAPNKTQSVMQAPITRRWLGMTGANRGPGNGF